MKSLSIFYRTLCTIVLVLTFSSACYAGSADITQEPQEDTTKRLTAARGTKIVIPARLSIEQFEQATQRQLANVEYSNALEKARSETYAAKLPVEKITGTFAGVYDATVAAFTNTLGGIDYAVSSRGPITIKEPLILGENDTLRIDAGGLTSVSQFIIDKPTGTISFFPHLPSAGVVSMVTGASISTINGTLSSIGSTFTVSATMTTICAITEITAELKIPVVTAALPEKHDDAKNVEALRRQQQNKKIVTAALENADAPKEELPAEGE